MTSISDIKDYNTLYTAYNRLKTEGDKTVSAANAKAIFGQDIDIDGDKAAEIWEFMQKANELSKSLIFKEVNSLKKLQDIKLAHISEDNPIRLQIAIESKITGYDKSSAALRMINKIIKTARSKISDKTDPEQILKTIYKIITEKYDLKNEDGGPHFISENFGKAEIMLDCDTYSYIYMAIGFELNLPISAVHMPAHTYVRWKDGSKRYNFETLTGEMKTEEKYNKDLKDNICDTSANINRLISSQYINRALFHNDSNNDILEIENYKEALRVDPGETKLYIMIGISAIEANDHSTAKKYLDLSVIFYPENPTIYLARADYYYKIKDYKRSLDDYMRSIKLSPISIDTYEKMVKVFDSFGAEGIKYLTLLIEKDPNDHISLHFRGNLYLQMKKYELAIKDYTGSMKIKPKFNYNYSERAEVYRQLRMYDKASKDMDNFLRVFDGKEPLPTK